MKKRLIGILLVILIVISSLLCFGGCKKKDENFPVTIGHTEISERPRNVAVLSDNLADMIIYMDEFQSQLCAISDACTQTELTQYLPSVGSETNPSIDELEKAGAEYVITDTPLSSTIKEKLKDKGMTVLNFKVPENDQQIATVYKSLGTFFGGKPDGKETGETSYQRLMDTLTAASKEAEDSKILKTVCYLYLNEGSKLCSFNNADCNGMVLNYIGATNVAANFNNKLVELSILNRSNPDYIFYDSQETLEYIKNNPELTNLKAIKNNNAFMLPKENLERLGETLLYTQRDIIAKIHGITSAATIDEPQGISHAANYGFTITDGVSYKYGDDAEDILAIQQRLLDLGYLVFDDDSAPTTYFGSKTEDAVRRFQTANGIESTGITNKTTLEKLFLSTTLSVNGKLVTPPSLPETTPTEGDTTAPTSGNSPAPNPDYMNKEYNIDLSEHKAYGVRDNGERDVHEDIKVIQERLHDLGYLTPDEDGYTDYYGPKTEEAMRQFEIVNSVDDPNGFAGYENLLLLFSNDALPNQ